MARPKTNKDRLTTSLKQVLIWIIPIGILLYEVIRVINHGWIPFWYDPGRDLLLARDNLDKLSLIGPPSGIPNVFYLPYWTWWNSLPLLISRDPRIATFLNITLPYFLILPIIFWKFRSVFGKYLSLLLLLIFLFNYSNRTSQFWSPNLAPLLIFLLSFAIWTTDRKNSSLSYFITGLLAAFGIGFNMGFGIGIFVLTSIFIGVYGFITQFKKSNVVYLRSLVAYLVGSLLVFLPFIFFELRHGGNQIESLIAMLSQSPVTLTGLTRLEMLQEFIKIPGVSLRISTILGLITVVLVIGNFLRSRAKYLNPSDKKLFLFLITILFGTMAIYLLAKNPKWDYHFIGMEAVFILLLGLLIRRTKLVAVLGGWLMVLGFSYLLLGTRLESSDFKQNLYLSQKEEIIQAIFEDQSEAEFVIFVYSPAIYTYDYDYLFWREGREKHQELGSSPTPEMVYLIIPPTTEAAQQDFIQFKTPVTSYITIGSQRYTDGTLVVTRRPYSLQDNR